MKKLFFLLLVACVLSVAVPGMSLSAETRTDTATESGDAEVFVDDSDRFTAFEEELLSRYAGRGIRSVEVAAYAKGISVATHTGNVMTDMHHRDIGGLGAALTNENVTCEVICDGLHICDEMLGIYFKVKSTDKFMMVSDCTALSGAPVGKYEGIFEGMALNVTPEGFVLTDTGRLCGSSQPVLFDIRNLVNNVGIPLETCLKMACLNPCIKYGFADRKGTIEVGKDADLVVISDDYQAQVTYAEGRKVYDRSTEGKIFNADYLNR